MLKVVYVSDHVRWVLTNYTNHPGESLLSSRLHVGKRKDPEDEVGGNLVGANNPEHATPTLSPHLAYATAFSQVKFFFLTSFWSTFSAKTEVPFSIRIR